MEKPKLKRGRKPTKPPPDPNLPKRGRGRPRKNPQALSSDLKWRLSVLLGGGFTLRAAAMALGTTEEALQQAFPAEISAGGAERQAEALYALFDQAKKGQTSAAKEYLKRGAMGGTVPQRPAKDLDEPRTRRPEPPGKKEQLIEEAKRGGEGTGWAGLLQ